MKTDTSHKKYIVGLNCGIPRPGILVRLLVIYEFVEEVQDAAAAWEDGDKTELVEVSRCWIG